MVLALALAVASFSAHALFGDDDARRAILDLRQRLDTTITAQNKLVEDNEQMRRSMLDLQTQIEILRNELAQSRGIQEQALRELEDLRRRQQEAAQGMEDRLRKMKSGDAPPASGMDGAEIRRIIIYTSGWFFRMAFAISLSKTVFPVFG